jgi:hypothetical protein
MLYLEFQWYLATESLEYLPFDLFLVINLVFEPLNLVFKPCVYCESVQHSIVNSIFSNIHYFPTYLQCKFVNSLNSIIHECK